MEAIKKIELNKVFKIILLAILGSLLLTISAKIKIPFYPVPMTMQTFVVLFLGITLGNKIGLLTISLYLFEGIFGLPVLATYLAGTFKYDKGIINSFLKLIVSVSVIYFFGMIWLGALIGWEKPIFKLGAQPFLLAELFKILLLLFLIPTLLKIKNLIKIT